MTIPEGVDPYSPYVPENMPKLEVGMRVQWRISSECDYRCGKCGTDFHSTTQCAECSDAAEGIIRVIRSRVTINHSPWLGSSCDGKTSGETSHTYFIDVHSKWDACEGFWAAAAELIPLEPTTNLQKE